MQKAIKRRKIMIPQIMSARRFTMFSKLRNTMNLRTVMLLTSM